MNCHPVLGKQGKPVQLSHDKERNLSTHLPGGKDPLHKTKKAAGWSWLAGCCPPSISRRRRLDSSLALEGALRRRRRSTRLRRRYERAMTRLRAAKTRIDGAEAGDLSRNGDRATGRIFGQFPQKCEKRILGMDSRKLDSRKGELEPREAAAEGASLRPLCRSPSRGHLVAYYVFWARLSKPKFRTWHREFCTRRVSKGTGGTGTPHPTRNPGAKVPFSALKLRLFGTGATPGAGETLFGWRHGKFLGPESLKFRGHLRVRRRREAAGNFKKPGGLPAAAAAGR